MEPTETRLYGRRAFLGVTAVGLSSLLWGRAAWRAVGGAAQPFVDALPPGLVPSGWRIYTVASTMPRFDPATWRLRIDGIVDRPVSLSYERLLALPAAEQVSTFHCVTGWTVSQRALARRALRRPARRRRAAPRGDGADVHLGREAVRRHA